MGNCAIVGINWGDEGKGRMVDYLAAEYDVIIRYQGGNNAGHTVINEYGEFKLNLLPSGVFRPGKLNVLGAGTVIDPAHLTGEIRALRARGVEISPENLIISDRAVMVLPMHAEQDALEERRLGADSFGSTKRGIAPAYGDKYMKKALKMGDLLRPAALERRLKLLVDWKSAVFSAAYGQPPLSYSDTLKWIEEHAAPLAGYIKDAGRALDAARAEGKTCLFEAQLGALRDLDYGIYPYTSSSNPLAAYAPVGSGLPSLKLGRVVGVVKAYSTCVGEGPFVGELTGESGVELREAGAEYGAATGRPRRVGWLDIVATRQGIALQGADELAFTKLDVLSNFNDIPVCVKYNMGGEIIENFPYPADLNECEPVYETLPGWRRDISGCRRYEDLPPAARDYVEYAERALGCPIRYISVGPERDQLILR